MPGYTKLLKTELKLKQATILKDGAETIYIGGGTPFFLPPEELTQLLLFVEETFVGNNTKEISIESLPSLITQEKAKIAKLRGITRVTFGMQSFNPDSLKLFGRGDEIDAVPEAIKNLTNVGITNIGADLIIGFPGEKEDELFAGIKTTIDLGIKHLSAYFLSVEQNTPLAKWVKNGTVKLDDDKTLANRYEKLNKVLTEYGFIRYEVANWSLPGYESQHNLNTWDYKTYLGLGPAAVGFDGEQRSVNTANLDEYRHLIEQDIIPLREIDIIDKEKEINERIMVGLRKSKGIDLIQLEKICNLTLLKVKKREIEQLLKKEWIIIENNFLRLSNSGFLWLDSITIELFI